MTDNLELPKKVALLKKGIRQAQASREALAQRLVQLQEESSRQAARLSIVVKLSPG